MAGKKKKFCLGADLVVTLQHTLYRLLRHCGYAHPNRLMERHTATSDR